MRTWDTSWTGQTKPWPAFEMTSQCRVAVTPGRPSPAVRVIILSMHDSADYVAQALHAGGLGQGARLEFHAFDVCHYEC